MINFVGVFLISVLAAGCSSPVPCQGLFYNIVSFRQEAAMEADVAGDPYLYVTVARLDSTSEEIRDRMQLLKEDGVWNLLYLGHDIVSAPANTCADSGPFYPYNVEFMLGTVGQATIDEDDFPTLSFDVQQPREDFLAELWNGFLLWGYMDSVPHNIQNIPVDTGSW